MLGLQTPHHKSDKTIATESRSVCLLGPGQSLGQSMDEDEKDCVKTPTAGGMDTLASVRACLSSSSLDGYLQDQRGECNSDTFNKTFPGSLTGALGGVARHASQQAEHGT